MVTVNRTQLHAHFSHVASPVSSSHRTFLPYVKRVQLHKFSRLHKFAQKKLKILLFSGDVDECVPYNGAEQWTRGFGYPEAQHWRPWSVGDVVAGYATVYDTPHNFTWATVRGAGHMAPLFQPVRVFNLFNRFLAGRSP